MTSRVPRRYRDHLRAAAAALVRVSSDGGDGGGTARRNLMVVNMGPAWVDDTLYELFGRCGNRLHTLAGDLSAAAR